MSLLADIKHGVRVHRRHAGTSIIAITTVAFGVVMASIVFALVDSMLFTDLPVPQGDRVVAIRYSDTASAKGDFPVWSGYFNYHDYDEYRRRATVFEEMGASVAARTYTISAGQKNTSFQGCRITANFLDILRVKPLLGRGFLETDAAKGAPRVVLISDRIWKEMFSASPDIVDQTAKIDGIDYTVVGVLPERMYFPENHDVWLPLASDLGTNPAPAVRRGGPAYTVFARLKDGVTLQQGKKECDALAVALADAYPDSNQGLRAVRMGKYPQSYRHSLDEADGVLRVMLGTACTVLVSICLGVACMLLAITATRMSELNLRFALGATRGRIFRQILTESFVLAALGCAAGAILAYFTSHVFSQYFSGYRSIPYWWDFGITPRRIAFIVGAMVVVGLVSGFLPGLAATRRNISTNLKKSEGSISQLLGRKIILRLVVAQVAFTSFLLIGFGNFVGSTNSILNFKIEFNADEIYSASLFVPEEYNSQQRASFYQNLEAGLKDASFVESYSYSTRQLLIRPNVRLVTLGGVEYSSPKEMPLATVEAVAPNYFDVLRLPLLKGESTDQSADYPGERLSIVNRAFAKKYFPDKDPIGQQLRVLGGFYRGNKNGQSPVRIVGIAPEVTGIVTPGGGESVSAEMGNEVVYVLGSPAKLGKAPSGHTENSRYVTLFLRFKPGVTANIGEELLRIIRTIDSNIAVQDLGTVRENWTTLSSNFRFLRDLFIVFAVGCLVISLIGIAGSISFVVLQRMKEFGLRVAIGALPGDIRAFILWKGTKNVLIGLLLGFVPGFALFYWVALKSPIINNHPLVYVIPGVLYIVTAAVVILSVSKKAGRASPMMLMREG